MSKPADKLDPAAARKARLARLDSSQESKGLVRSNFPSIEDLYDNGKLQALKSYKYQSVDNSPLSHYVLRHYWNWATTFFPMWMAPNLITLIGFGFIIFAVILIMLTMPDLVGPAHPAVYFTLAACLWLYSTFDNVDGKQARRTQSSSPLGELFDHGCDALNCPLGAIMQIASMGLGSSWYSAVAIFIATWGMYLPIWEEYHTGVLYLGYINGPTEGIVSFCIIMCLSGIFGPQIWLTKLGVQFPKLFADTLLANYDVACVVLFACLFCFTCIFLPSSMWAVYRACKKNGTSFRASLTRLAPMTAGTLFGWMWLWSPHSVVRRDNLLLFICTVGVVFGKMSCKILLAHLTKQPFPLQTSFMMPLVIGSIIVNLPVVTPIKFTLPEGSERVFLLIYFVSASTSFTIWAYHVITSFCEYLDIYCLRLKPKKA